jgi:hypothetical protein
VCAWCGSDLGEKKPAGRPKGKKAAAKASARGARIGKSRKDPDVVSTICRRCAKRLAAYRGPVLVVSQDWARLYEELAEIMKDRPDIRVVLDRRQEKTEDRESEWDGPERRRKDKPVEID